MTPNPKLTSMHVRKEDEILPDVLDPDYPRSRLIRSLYKWNQERRGDP